MIVNPMSHNISPMAMAEEIRQGLRFARINEELLEVLKSTIVWLVRYADKNNIELPSDEIVRRLDQAQDLVNQIHSYKPSDDSYQPDESDGKLTEPQMNRFNN